MKKENYKYIIKVFVILILMTVAGVFIINQYIFMTRGIRELAPFQLGENDIVESETKNTIVIISKNPAKPDTATVKIIQKTVLRPHNEENIITINAKDYYIEYFNTNVYDIKFGKKGEGINMGGPKWVGENYFTWLNNYGFFPKVTEVEIEYVFDNVKSVENLDVQVGVVRR